MPTIFRHNNKILVLGLLINLILSGITVHAQTTSGEIAINPCTVDCLRLTVPSQLIKSTPTKFDNTKTNIYLRGNYGMEQGIMVRNLQETGGFDVNMQITNLQLIGSPGIALPYENIGMLTYNDSSASSVDGNNMFGDPLPISLIDPVETGETVEPFSQTELDAQIATNDFDNYFTYFTGTSTTSDSIKIMETNPANNNRGDYSVGLGLIIILPDDAINSYSITDGDYFATITFTLTST